MNYDKSVLTAETTVRDYTASFILHSGDTVVQTYRSDESLCAHYLSLKEWAVWELSNPLDHILNGGGDFIVTDKVAFPKSDLNRVDMMFVERKVVVKSPLSS